MWIYISVIILIIVILSAAVIYHDTHSFVVRNYEMSSDKIEGELKLVLLSDLHGYVFGKDNEKLIDAVKECKPDIVLCAGDMMTAHLVKGRIQYEAGMNVLTQLAKDFPVYAGNGNHERKLKTSTQQFGNLFDRYRSGLVRAGVTMLENDSCMLPGRNVRISGLDLELTYFTKVVKKKMDKGYVDRLLGPADKKAFQILIDHNPQ